MIGENLRRARKILGKTTYEMAELAGMTQPSYVRCENGKMDIRASALNKLYYATGLNPSFICLGELPIIKR